MRYVMEPTMIDVTIKACWVAFSMMLGTAHRDWVILDTGEGVISSGVLAAQNAIGR